MQRDIQPVPDLSPEPEDAGIESAVHSDDDSGSLKVYVSEEAVEAAQDVIEPPDDSGGTSADL